MDWNIWVWKQVYMFILTDFKKWWSDVSFLIPVSTIILILRKVKFETKHDQFLSRVAKGKKMGMWLSSWLHKTKRPEHKALFKREMFGNKTTGCLVSNLLPLGHLVSPRSIALDKIWTTTNFDQQKILFVKHAWYRLAPQNNVKPCYQTTVWPPNISRLDRAYE